MTDERRTGILLIRHAQSAPDPAIAEPQWPLSARGREQARQLALELESRGISRIFASPYLRARDTVHPLAELLRLPVSIVADLRERKLGEGMRDDWEALLERAWADLSFALPEGESGLQVQARVERALRELAEAHPGELLAVCSHGNAIGLFLNKLDPDFGHAQWRAMKNPDVFHVAWNGRGWRRV